MKFITFTILPLIVGMSCSALSQPGQAVNDQVESDCSKWLYFVPPNNDLLSLTLEWKYGRVDDTLYPRCKVSVLSSKDGTVKKEILIPGAKYVEGFNVAHDGSSFVVFCGNNRADAYELQMYSLKDSCWVWQKQWYGEVAEQNVFERDSLNKLYKRTWYTPKFLRLSYTRDDKQIVCISALNIVISDAETGSPVRVSKSMASFFDSEDYQSSRLMRYALSENGRFLAFWRARYMTWSSYSNEEPLSLLLEYAWYGIRWLFCLGSIPNYLNVWDVEHDSLYCKLKIPYEEILGVPAFTSDEKEVVVGPVGNATFRVFSLDDKTLKKEFVQERFADVTISRFFAYSNDDFKVIAPDGVHFAACYFTLKKPSDPLYGVNPAIFVMDFGNGHLMSEYDKAPPSVGPFDRYSVAFSPDSQYFAFVTYDHKAMWHSRYDSTSVWLREFGNKIKLYETKTWERIW